MATLYDLHVDALYRLGVLSEQNPAPTAYQNAVGIRAFNDLLDSLPNRGVGDVLQTRRVESSVQLSVPTIAQVIATAPVTITLPRQPRDGHRVQINDVGTDFSVRPVTVDRNGWLINGVAADATLSAAGQSIEYFFRADLGDWKPVSRPLLQTADLPYPAAHDGDFVSLLVVELADLHGAALKPGQDARAYGALTRLQAQYMPDLSVAYDRGLTDLPSLSGYERGRKSGS